MPAGTTNKLLLLTGYKGWSQLEETFQTKGMIYRAGAEAKKLGHVLDWKSM